MSAGDELPLSFGECDDEYDNRQAPTKDEMEQKDLALREHMNKRRQLLADEIRKQPLLTKLFDNIKQIDEAPLKQIYATLYSDASTETCDKMISKIKITFNRDKIQKPLLNKSWQQEESGQACRHSEHEQEPAG